MSEPNIHFSSKTDMWETPQAFFDALNNKYHFTLDVCAIPHNTKCKKFFTQEDNALLQDWAGACWMNPPYGRKIKVWMEKATIEAQKKGTIVVCLVPSRTDTFWWHEYVMQGKIEFIRGRLKFSGHGTQRTIPLRVS